MSNAGTVDPRRAKTCGKTCALGALKYLTGGATEARIGIGREANTKTCDRARQTGFPAYARAGPLSLELAMSRVLFCLGGFAAGMIGALLLAAATNRPGAKDAKIKELEQANAALTASVEKANASITAAQNAAEKSAAEVERLLDAREGLDVRLVETEKQLRRAQSAKETHTAAPPKAEAKPAPSAAERAYVAAVRTYLDECRAVAKLLTLVPSPLKFKQRCDVALDLYTRIPDAPAGTDPNGQIAFMLKQIDLSFGIAQLDVNNRSDFVRLGSDVDADKADAACKKIAAQQRESIISVEKALGAQSEARD